MGRGDLDTDNFISEFFEDGIQRSLFSRADIITVSEEAQKESYDLDAFRELTEEGVEGGDDEEEEEN